MKKGKLLIISGFSGVGKGTVVKYILDNYSDIRFQFQPQQEVPERARLTAHIIISLTTEKFEDMIKNNQLFGVC